MNSNKRHVTPAFIAAWILLFCAYNSVANASPFNLRVSRDSLETLLQQTKTSDGARRLQLLVHLCDIDLSLGDTTHIYPCWNEAVHQRNAAAIDDIAVPLTLRYLNKGQLDSAEVWTARCKQYLAGTQREANLEYIQLMNDIRRFDEYDLLANRLIKEQIQLDAAREPYRTMRILYSLGMISNIGHANIKKLTLKPSSEYLSEALDIAKKLPFREGARFQRQLLLALSSSEIAYARQYLAFANRFLEEPDIQARPFYSRRNLLSAYEKMITQGTSIPREEVDGYYNSILSIVQKRPYDAPMPLDYYIPRLSYYYNEAIGNREEAIRWCDSIIAVAPKYRLDACYFYEFKVNHLGELGRWKEGYYSAMNLIEIKDSLANASNEKKLSELQTQYEVDTYKRETAAHRTKLIFSAIVIFLLLLVLILTTLYYKRLKTKNRILLEQLEQYTRNLKKEKEKEEKEKEEREERMQTKSSPALTTPQPFGLFGKLEALMRKEKLYLNPELNREMLVERLGTNKNKLSEAIATATDSNLADYIMELRLQEALLLMEADVELSLTEIAEQAGFNVYSSFYRSFSKQYGVKPTEYRKYLKK